jgi:hypothetical protein
MEQRRMYVQGELYMIRRFLELEGELLREGG